MSYHKHEPIEIKPFIDDANLLDYCDCGAIRFRDAKDWWIPESYDRLSRIFELQKELQERMGEEPLFDQEFVKTMTLAAIVELAEFVQCTDWKPWKEPTGWKRDAAVEELVDAFHFVVNLALALGLTADELFEAYVKKNDENRRRQDEGY